MSELDARLLDYLRHIASAIERIQRYVAPAGQSGFLANELVQDAVIRNLEIIGEASRNIVLRCPQYADAHPELPLTAAYQMRNAMTHGYFKVDLAIVWRTVVDDLPSLLMKVQDAIYGLSKTQGPNPTPIDPC